MWSESISNYSSKNNGHVDGSKECEKLKTKILIIHGEKDGAIPIEHMRDMSKTLGCKLVELPGVKHFTWYDNLEGTVKPIEEFLKH